MSIVTYCTDYTISSVLHLYVLDSICETQWK